MVSTFVVGVCDDEVLVAMSALSSALSDVGGGVAPLLSRIDRIGELRQHGWAYREIVQEPPVVVQSSLVLLERAIQATHAARRLEAQVLYEEGMTMESIASLLSVTRQRVGTMLQRG